MGSSRHSTIIVASAAAALAIACAGSAAPPASPSMSMPPAASVLPPNVAGVWNGTAVDSQGATTVSWALTQSGTSVSGTVATQAVNPADGSCNSCHRNKSGTFSGTISGTSLTLSMFFAAGADGDPTPECSATLTGSASTIATSRISAAYSGADTCEGPFTNGTMTMARHQ